MRRRRVLSEGGPDKAGRSAGSRGGGAFAEVDRDFFVSYTDPNEAWARWIALELERAGYSTVSQVLDFRPGQDFAHAMHQAISGAARTIAVLSPAYLSSEFGEAEWRAAFVDDPTGERGRLIPVRVQPCRPLGLLRARVYIDLVDAEEEVARRRLLDGVGASPRTRSDPARFPGRGNGRRGAADRFPGAGPEISNLPPRNRNFAGRGELIEHLHRRLRTGTAAPSIEAVHGLGGIGKTELVREFAHRFASDYDIVWFVAAEQPTTAVVSLAGLAGRLGLPPQPDRSTAVEELFDHLRGCERWLLIYDNAEEPTHLEGLLPSGGGGHVLVTSRWSAWSRWAEPVRLEVLARGESVQFLAQRAGLVDSGGLGELAEFLGDLPLALEEAAAYLEATNVALDDYLLLVRDRMRELFQLAAGPARMPVGAADRHRVASVWLVSLDRVRAQAPVAEQLLALCAMLAPDVPRALLVDHADVLSSELAAVLGDPIAHNATLALVGRYSLATVSGSEVCLHRLVQAVIRARQSSAEERRWAGVALALVRAAVDEALSAEEWSAFERVLPHLLAAVGHAERLHVAGDIAGDLLGDAAGYSFDHGHYRQALPLAARAVSVTRSALGPEHVQTGVRLGQLGRIRHAAGELAPARADLERALRIGIAAVGRDDPVIGDLHNDLGKVLHDQGDLTGAQVQFERALEICRTAFGAEHPIVGSRRTNLGLVLQDQGDLAAARVEHEEALRIGLGPLAADDREIGLRQNNLGLVLRLQGDLAGARTHYEHALEIAVKALGPEHPTVATLCGNLGSVLRMLGDAAGAREELVRALRIGERSLGPEHHSIGPICNNLGWALHDLGDLVGARAHYERALRISEAALGPEHPAIGTRCTNLGGLLEELGDLVGARVHFERALRITVEVLGPEHPDVVDLRRALSRLDGG